MSKVITLLGAVAHWTDVLRAANTPKILLAIFAVWVLAPFVGLLVLRVSKVWTAVMIAGTLAIYGYAAFGPPLAKPLLYSCWFHQFRGR